MAPTISLSLSLSLSGTFIPGLLQTRWPWLPCTDMRMRQRTTRHTMEWVHSYLEKGRGYCNDRYWVAADTYGSQQTPLIQAFRKVTFLLPGELKAPCLALQGRTVIVITQSSLGHYVETPPLFSAFVLVCLEIWSIFSVWIIQPIPRSEPNVLFRDLEPVTLGGFNLIFQGTQYPRSLGFHVVSCCFGEDNSVSEPLNSQIPQRHMWPIIPDLKETSPRCWALGFYPAEFTNLGRCRPRTWSLWRPGPQGMEPYRRRLWWCLLGRSRNTHAKCCMRDCLSHSPWDGVRRVCCQWKQESSGDPE